MKMVGKFNFLIQTWLDISFVINMVSMLSNKPQTPHLDDMKQIKIRSKVI
jgi:hypothetical protein